MSLWSTTGVFKKSVTNTKNGMFVQTSQWPRAGDICCVCFAIRVRFIVIRPHLNVMMTTRDSVWAGVIMSFTARFVACPFWSSIGALHDNIVVTLESVPLPRIATVADCSGIHLHFTGNILRVYLSLYVVPSNRITDRIWTASNQIWTNNSPLCATSWITPWVQMNSFVALFMKGELRLLLQHFHWGSNNHHVFNLAHCYIREKWSDAVEPWWGWFQLEPYR